MAQHTKEDNKSTLKDFRDAVNMSPKDLENWLKTEESKSVGQKDHEGDESTGHESGRYIVQLLRKSEDDFSEDDYNQMRRVVSYVHRHLAQRPSSDIEDSRWRYSLKNWGHEPLKD